MSANVGRFNTEIASFGPISNLGRMLALSLLLHTIAFVPFLLPGQGRIGNERAQFLDLDLGMNARSEPLSGPGKTAPAADEKAPESLTPEAETISELARLKENARRSLESAKTQPAAVEGASLGLGMTNGFFASIGEGETLRDDIRDYYFEILRRINEKWWVNGEGRMVGSKRAVFYLVIARNGTIVERMMAESSGNPACDREMMRALEAASPLPPLPESYRGDFFQAPLKFNAPLTFLKSLPLAG